VSALKTPLRGVALSAVLSAASQAVGLIQLALLLCRWGASNETDAYTFLFGVGVGPAQLIAVGVLYPSLLNGVGLTRRGHAALTAALLLTSPAAVAVGAAWFASRRGVTSILLTIALLAAINSAVQALSWRRAVIAEAKGDARWAASIALPANAFAAMVLLGPWPTSGDAVVAMQTGLVVGNFAYFIAIRRQGIAQLLQATGSASPSHQAWFLAKASSSYAAAIGLQACAATLPPSALTLLSIPVKVVVGLVGTAVNVAMPRLVNMHTDSKEAAVAFLRVAAMIGMLGGLACTLVLYAFRPMSGTYAMLTTAWLVASTGSAIAQRLAFRFLGASASRSVIVIPLFVTAATVASSLVSSFSVGTVICAYALLDALVASVLLARLRLPIEAFTGIALSVVVLGAGAAGLVV
jgi:hypothetical protein